MVKYKLGVSNLQRSRIEVQNGQLHSTIAQNKAY